MKIENLKNKLKDFLGVNEIKISNRGDVMSFSDDKKRVVSAKVVASIAQLCGFTHIEIVSEDYVFIKLKKDTKIFFYDKNTNKHINNFFEHYFGGGNK